MALKHSTPMEDPPSADSTTEEEEEHSSSSSEDSASSEDEVKKTPKPSSPQQPPKNPETATTITPKSESEESDSDSESEPEKTPVSNIRLITTKPMEETKNAAKRALEKDTDQKDAKKAKKISGTDEEHHDDDDSKQLTSDSKKQGLVQKHLFQRLFSEADEIAMLKGMIDYSLANKGVDPMTDFNGYFDFVKGSLHFDVKKSQLIDKSKRLKSKYWKQGGGVPTKLKGHDLKVYELSKKVWGCGGEESSAAVSKINEKVLRTPRPNASATPKVADLVAEGKKMKMVKIDGIKEVTRSGSKGVLFDTNVGLVGLNEYVVKNGLELVNLSERVELEERWRKLQLSQLELFVEQSKLIFDQAKLMLEAAKNV